jgi:hypothetical protein
MSKEYWLWSVAKLSKIYGVLGTYHVSHRRSTIGKTRGAEEAEQEPQNEEAAEVVDDSRRYAQNNEENKARRVHSVPADRRNFAQWSKQQGTNAICNLSALRM